MIIQYIKERIILSIKDFKTWKKKRKYNHKQYPGKIRLFLRTWNPLNIIKQHDLLYEYYNNGLSKKGKQELLKKYYREFPYLFKVKNITAKTLWETLN